MNRRVGIFAGVFVICLFISFSCPKKALAVTLFSTGFESSNVSPWVSSGGGATATIAADIYRSGAASIKVTHDKTSSYGFQNTIQNIEGGAFYQALGYGKTSDANIASYFLRVAWYASTDGSGSQLSSPNDSNAVSTNGDWVLLDTGTIQAPASANSAKIRLVLTSKTSGQLASAYFDDTLFQEAIAPTSTPAPTSIPTSTPIPVKTPTPAPSPTPKTVSATPTMSLSDYVDTLTSSPESKTTGSAEVLADSTIDAQFGQKDEKNQKEVKILGVGKNRNAQVLIAIGMVLVIGCGILFYRMHVLGKKW